MINRIISSLNFSVKFNNFQMNNSMIMNFNCQDLSYKLKEKNKLYSQLCRPTYEYVSEKTSFLNNLVIVENRLLV